MLGRAEEITGAAVFKIIFCHGKTVRCVAQEAQPLFNGVVLVVGNQDAAGIRRSAPDTSAELMQRRQTEPLGVFDDHNRSVGHIDADLDNSGGDQHVQFPRLKFQHHFVFFFGLHLAVQQADAPVGQQRADGLGIILFDGLHICGHLVFLDGRADHVGLMPRGKLLFNKAVHVPPLFAGDEPGLDGLAAGRQFVQHRDVQIAVHQQAQRARDGRGAHHQQVGALRLACQQAALPHAEAVLLVHDGQAQVFELDRIGQHRVGAYHQPGAAVGNSFQRDLFLFGFHAAHQQRDVDAEGFQPVGQCSGMLPGQDFGGSQHGALPAVLRGKPDGRRSHQRFAAADITLQQAIHRHLTAQVVHNFLGRALLCAGGRIGQAAPERGKVHLVHWCAGLAPTVAAQQKDADLEHVQLFKDQAAARPGQVLGALRGVDTAHGLGLGGHAVAGQQLRRQRVGQLVHVLQRRVGAGGLPRGGQALGAGVDGHKGAGSHLRLGAHQRVQQFTAGHGAADAALEVVGLADDEFIGHVGRVEPGQPQHAGVIRGQHPHQRPPAFDAADRFFLQHGGADTAVHVVRCADYGVGLGVVNVFAGVAQKQIPDGGNAELFKLFSKRRADAL